MGDQNGSITFTDNERTVFAIFSHEFKGRTVYDYKREILAFKEFLNSKKIDTLFKAHFNVAIEYMDKLNKDGSKSSSTRQRIYYQLLGFYNFLLDKEFIEINPFWKVKKPPASKQIKKERTPNFKELEQLFNTLVSDFSLRDLALVSVIATTGLRISEVLSIKWSDFVIDDEGNVGFKIQNDGEGRYVRVLSTVWNLLNRYREEFLEVDDSYLKKDYYVFISSINRYREYPHGVGPLTQSTARNILVKACTKAKIRTFTPKDLRHAHAIFALKLGASLEEVKEQLGWNNKNLIYRYHGVMEQIQRPANIYTERFFERIIKE